jgi:pimeloyl-ACP methyl ester carboxylesterase
MAKRLCAVVACCLLAGGSAYAQDRPAVFVHGLNGNANTWNPAAARLQAELAISPYVPTLPWAEPFGTQAGRLQSQLGALPASTIAIGHSNGGIVSRQWSTQHSLSGVVTVGSPQRGAPLVNNVLSALGFNQNLYAVAGLAFSALGAQPNEFWDVYLYVEIALQWAQGIGFDNFYKIAGLGLATQYPVLGQMATGSAFLQQLNSSGNLSREASQIAARVGLVYELHKYWMLGPLRLYDQYRADLWYPRMWSAIYILENAGVYLVANYSWHATAMQIANRLFSVAGALRQVDPAWCWAVTNDASCNTPHDGVVPVWSQVYPGGTNYGVTGPSHLQEANSSDAALSYVLTSHMGVVTRGSAPPPPPPTPDPGSPDMLQPGEQLSPGQSRTSPNGQYELSYQGDGNLVLYRMSDGQPLWATNTFTPGVVEMQNDGNLVIYSSGGGAIWWTGTVGYPGARLAVQSDSNLVIYDYYGFPIWSRF